MIRSYSNVCEFDSMMDNIESIKSKVINGILDKAFLNGDCGDFKIDLDLVLDELLVNIVEHCHNDRGKFKIYYEIMGDMVDIIVSDCGVIDINDKSVKPIDKIQPTNKKVFGGIGLYTVKHIVDNIKMFNVFKNGNKKPYGMIVCVKKFIPNQCYTTAATMH